MEEKTKYCPHCGKPIKATALKCIHCKQWVDGRERQSVQPGATGNGSTPSGISPVMAIIAAFAMIVLGVLIYYLVKSDDDNSEPDRTEKYYDNSSSRDHDRSSSYYDDDDDYSSSSSSSYGSSRSGTYTIPCVMCDGSKKGDDGSECRYCLGYGEFECYYDYGACRLGCGCDRFLTVHGYDLCIDCMLRECHGRKSDHRSM